MIIIQVNYVNILVTEEVGAVILQALMSRKITFIETSVVDNSLVYRFPKQTNINIIYNPKVESCNG